MSTNNADAAVHLAEADIISQFHEICGSNVKLTSPQILHLYRMSNSNLMQAINIYLDGNYKPSPLPSTDSTSETTAKGSSNSRRHCLGQIQIEGHSLVNNLKPIDFQNLSLEIQGAQCISGLLTESGRRVGRLSRTIELAYGPLVQKGWIKLDLNCLYVPEPTRVFTPLLFEGTIYLKKKIAAQSDNQVIARELYKVLQLFENQNTQGREDSRKRLRDGSSASTGSPSTKQLDSLYASCSGESLDPSHASYVTDLNSYLKGLSLRKYQNQALVWLVNRETEDQFASSEIHPFWEKKSFHTGDSTHYYMNHIEQTATLSIPPPPRPCLGGILADDMGMGKTIMLLALILARKHCVKDAAGTTKRRCQTLVVCPLSLLHQWKSEFESHSADGALSVTTLYENDASQQSSLTQYDVVITTYGKLAAAYKSGSSVLYQVQWTRVVLDEAHSIKNFSTNYFRSCMALEATYRWCLTGTPIQNNLNDIHALIRFLKYEPWSTVSWWKKVISDPYQSSNETEREGALVRLKAALSPILLRRTKSTRNQDGDLIVQLPPKSIDVVELTLSQTEREFYNAVYERSKASFLGFVASSSGDKGNSGLLTVLALMLQLRQACDHPFLVLGREKVVTDENSDPKRDTAQNIHDIDYETLWEQLTATTENRRNRKLPQHSMQQQSSTKTYVQSVINEIKAEGLASQECPICLDPPTEAVLTPCVHLLCRDCAIDAINNQDAKECPVCRASMSESDLISITDTGTTNEDIKADIEKSKSTAVVVGSTKLSQLQTDLKRLFKDDSSTKVVVFSQWTHMIDLIENTLTNDGISHLRFDGTLSQLKREKTLVAFDSNPECRVLLASLKAGGVGLNLTTANVVIIFDPWWNPAIEDQAIDRVHRLGQNKPVKVLKYVVKDTVEDQMILKIQKKKAKLANTILTIGANDQQNGRLNLDDVQQFFKL